MTTLDINTLTPEQIAELTPEQMQELIGDEGDNDDSQPSAGEDKAVTQEAEPKTEPDKKDEEEAKPKGIAAKDGDNIIPYSVLESTRAKATEAERLAEQLAKDKADLEKEKLELAEKLRALSEINDDGEIDDEMVEALKEELPEVAEKIQALQAKFKVANAKLQEKEVALQQQQVEVVKKTVQDAIDSVPKLAHIQATSPRLFQMAIEIDNELKQDPALQGLPMAERFKKTVEKLEGELGIKINVSSQAKQEPEAKGITSLNDIPGGSLPVTDELMARLERSPAELDALMNKMTPQQIDDFLAQASKHLT